VERLSSSGQRPPFLVSRCDLHVDGRGVWNASVEFGELEVAYLVTVFDIASALRSSDILDFDLRRLFTYICFTALIGCGISGASGRLWIHSITPFGHLKTSELEIHVSLPKLRRSVCRLVFARTGSRGCRCITSVMFSSSWCFRPISLRVRAGVSG
jgi:hypothetical protein